MRDDSDSENPLITTLKDLAEEMDSDDIYIILGNLYLTGDSQFNIKANITQSMIYYEKAADMGNNEARAYVGVNALNKDYDKAFKYLSKCAESDSAFCHHSLGQLYENDMFEGFNMTESVMHYEIALENEYYEAAMKLSDIYISVDEYYDSEKADDYMDLYLNHSVPLNILNEEAATYLRMRAMSYDDTKDRTFHSHKLFKLIEKSEIETDIKLWYNIGYRKYILGEFDRALMCFSFGALMHHPESIRAAGFIWANNMTQELTCQFGHPLFCAATYYLRGVMQDDVDSGIELAKVNIEISLLNHATTSNVRETMIVAAIDSYENFQNRSDHAKFNNALMAYEGTQSVEANSTKTHQLLDELIENGWEKGIKFMSLLPTYLTKYYLRVFESYTHLSSLMI